jgi:AsmA protein
VGGHVSILGTITLAAGYEQLSVDGFNVSGDLRGIVDQPTEINFDARAIQVDTAAQSVTLGEMDLSVLGLNMSANVNAFSYAGTPQPTMSLRVNEFSLMDLMQTLGSEPPVTADPNALQRVSFNANAAVGETALVLSDMSLKMDDTRRAPVRSRRRPHRPGSIHGAR